MSFPTWNINFQTRSRFYPQGYTREHYNKAYKAIRNSSTGFIAKPAVREYIFSRDNYQCKACGTTENLTIDHIVSVYACSRGKLPLEALNIPDNLQTLCKSCNSSQTP